MPAFAYRGRNAAGEAVEGALEGATAAEVADQLFGQGITPLDIKPAPDSAVRAKSDAAPEISPWFGDKVEHVDVLLFTRQIYTLLKAGVPIMRALGGLQDSTSNTAMKAVLGHIRESLDSGRELAVSLARHPRVFTPFYLSMVRVGEMTGRLEEIFLRLFDHMEFERFMRDQVKSALRYPMFVVIAMAIAIIVVNVWVIPAFAQVFKGFNAQLPLMTRLLLAFSGFMVNWWHVQIVGLITLGLAFRTWKQTPRGRYQWDRIKLKIPIAGKIVRKATLARFARSFALAARSGVPIMQALKNVADTMDNAYFSEKIDRVREGVERGESVLRAAIATGIFTPVVLQMIAVGEESGSLDEMMEEVAGMYQKEVEYELKSLSQQIEPILITMLGIMVLILALGVFLPIWDLGRAAIKQ